MDKARILHQNSGKLLAPLLYLSPKKKQGKCLSSATNLSSPISPLTSKSLFSSPASSIVLKSRNSLKRVSSDQDNVFPQWLLERHDFKMSYLANASEIDIGKICSKPHKLRDSLENRELNSWCRSCAFFKPFSDFTCSEVCSRLSTQEYPPGKVIIQEGEPGDRMFIIYKGRVGIYKQGFSGALDILGSTNAVGETSLETNCLRTASVISIDTVVALKLMKEDYQNIVLRQKHKQRICIVNLLKDIPFFQSLLSAKLELLAWSMLLMHYDPQQTVYLEGQMASGVYFIKEGTVQLFTHVTVINKKNIPIAFNKKETLVHRKTYEINVKKVMKGDFFGEEETLNQGKRKHKAVCLENCEILLLKKEVIFELLGEKERSAIENIHEKPKTKKILAKELQKMLKAKKIKYTAILDATSVAPLPQGRNEIDRKLRKKAMLAKSAHFKFHKEATESLIKEDCFYQK
ncbi:hypothetical protein SteCoe_3541 [Stentor coeruleus]|uniref:Cyclic nucleotide-binding domain-containing protein n=1 Tax=Stentor coeruleus TaxID=5963 RepID=A0A1R2CWN0_9CILI|nr:hypothetical protein SteCoe_3541 [Stentor coeruleus]